MSESGLGDQVLIYVKCNSLTEDYHAITKGGFCFSVSNRGAQILL